MGLTPDSNFESKLFFFERQNVGALNEVHSRWRFEIFFIFTPTWGNDPN